MLEAAAAGLPMVTFDLPSLRDMLDDGKNAVVVERVGDEDRFVEATLAALDGLPAHQQCAMSMWDELRQRFDNTSSANDELDRTYTGARSG